MEKTAIMAATVLCCCLVSCSNGIKQDVANTAHIKGQLMDMGGKNVRMGFDGADLCWATSRDILLRTDAAGYFDTTFVLPPPSIIPSAATHCILLRG